MFNAGHVREVALNDARQFFAESLLASFFVAVP